MKKFMLIPTCVLFVLSLFFITPQDIYAYGYGLRGKDTLVAVYENITSSIQNSDYESVQNQVKIIEVPLSNYLNYYGINLKPALSKGIKEENQDIIIATIEQLIYFAVREKIYWNIKDKLEKFVASKARLKVIFQYYAVLKPKIVKSDQENNTKHKQEIQDLIMGMKNTLGTAGAFGYNAKPPNLEEFVRLSSRLEKVLVLIFPHFKEGYGAKINPH